jgi:anti-anti-sigma regulatory factor
MLHLEIATLDDTGRVVVQASGELREPASDSLLELAEKLARARVRSVDLDLAGVTAADVAGVRALTVLRAALDDLDVELTICNADLKLYPVDWHAVPQTDPFARTAR